MIVQFAETDVPNSNGTIYPKEMMKKAVAEYQTTLPSFGMFLDSYSWTNPNIDIGQISHRINSVHFVDNKVFAEISIASDFPMGEILEALDKNNLNLRFSPVGRGTFSKEEPNTISDYELISISVTCQE